MRAYASSLRATGSASLASYRASSRASGSAGDSFGTMNILSRDHLKNVLSRALRSLRTSVVRFHFVRRTHALGAEIRVVCGPPPWLNDRLRVRAVSLRYAIQLDSSQALACHFFLDDIVANHRDASAECTRRSVSDYGQLVVGSWRRNHCRSIF